MYYFVLRLLLPNYGNHYIILLASLRPELEVNVMSRETDTKDKYIIGAIAKIVKPIKNSIINAMPQFAQNHYKNYAWHSCQLDTFL